MKKSINKLLVITLLIVFPIVIIFAIVALLLNQSLFTDPIRYYINTVMGVSIWVIFAKEYFSRQSVQKEDGHSEFKVVDCMAIILAISTICYSIIQMCNPPIGFAQMLSLVIWNTAIIVYTIWAKPTKMRVLFLCLITTFVSVLYIAPFTYQNHYEKEIYKAINSADNYKAERIYRLENNDEHKAWYESSDYQDSGDSFKELLDDKYFTTNFKDTLQKSIYTYQQFKNTDSSVLCPTIAVQFLNGTQVDWRGGLRLKVSSSSANGDIAKFNIDRVLLNGISYDYEIVDSGDSWIEISFDNLKGISGIKTITFLDGYAMDQNGNLSDKGSVAFIYFGYDLIFLILVAIFIIVFSVHCCVKYKVLISHKKEQ